MNIRVGLIGAGFIGGRHAESLSRLPDVRVTAVADARPERAQRLADDVGGRAYGDWRRLLDVEDLDALYVCVPPFAHGDIEDAAVDRGLPLFIEKPLAADCATAARLADRIEAAGLLTAVGYHWRYLDTVERARRSLADRPPQLAVGVWLDKAPRVEWWSRRAQSGGQTVEQATHVFDLARILVGEVVSGVALERRWPDGPGDISHALTAAVRFESGAVGSFSNTCLLSRGFRIGLEVLAPGLALWLTEHGMTISDADGEVTVARTGDPIHAEDAAFTAAVAGRGDDIRAPYSEAIRTHRLVTAVADAALGDGIIRGSAGESAASEAQ